MSIFDHYARYYDLLYAEKDYSAEARYINTIMDRYGIGSGSVLELGCGTGRHAICLAERGYDIHGIDLSERMIDQAKSCITTLPVDTKMRIVFEHGDIRTFKLGRRLDAVISLFHVMSYQLTNDDLRAAFNTASIHLKPGGLFIFDCWYGPAVLTDQPHDREKCLEGPDILVKRDAHPVMYPNENRVDVHYRITITEKATSQVKSFEEVHTMRYLFLPEIDILMSEHGMNMVACEAWMTGESPGFGTWNVCIVGCR
jgi:SAM-dependent methyltransferase